MIVASRVSLQDDKQIIVLDWSDGDVSPYRLKGGRTIVFNPCMQLPEGLKLEITIPTEDDLKPKARGLEGFEKHRC